jgi:histone H3/H4
MKKKSLRRGESYSSEYLDDEIQAFVVSRYCKGWKEERIRKAVAKLLEKSLDEVEPHIARAEVLAARNQGRLSYVTGHQQELSSELLTSLLKDRIRSKRTTLEQPPGIEVVATTETSDVAHLGAKRLHAEIIAYFKASDRDVLNIGFAGGLTPSLTAKALAELLATPDIWPEEIYCVAPKKTIAFHSLVGIINSTYQEVDPNAFLMYLTSGRSSPAKLPFNLRFYRMPAPGIVTWEEYRHLIGRNGKDGFGLVSDAINRHSLIDIAVISCGHWKPNCSSAFDYLKDVCEVSHNLRPAWSATVAALAAHNVLGDLMWWPIGERGPFVMEHTLRVVSLLSIFDLVRMANPRPNHPATNTSTLNKKVLLLVGPCSGLECRESKGNLLSRILRMPRLPMTNLIVDSRSARDCIAQLSS